MTNLEMPKEYYGNVMKGSKYTKTAPRYWTHDEEQWCLEQKRNGYSVDAIAEAVGRSEVSVSIKLKRLSVRAGSYNKDHIADKYSTNLTFVDYIKPKSVMDVYCGTKSFYKGIDGIKKCITNDKNKDIKADYHMDAKKFLCQMYINGERCDLIDLDPYGSTYDCLDIAIKLAKKGIAVTLGEMSQKRFKRFDFVRPRYGITSLEEYTSSNMIKEIQRIGECNKKILTPIFIRDWKNISRVWFEISDMKITEQWNP